MGKDAWWTRHEDADEDDDEGYIFAEGLSG